MVGNFGFTHTPDIVFGIGSRNKLVSVVQQYGNKVLLLTGKTSFERNKLAVELVEQIDLAGQQIVKYVVGQEPSPKIIDDIVGENKNAKIDIVIGIGGGSVMDAGKAVSAMLTVEGSVKDYLEGVGKYEHPGTKIPFIAIPTTSGTGSEATKNAVISELGPSGYKKSLRHNNFVPDVAIVDPELTVTCPPKVTAAGGMDAFTQLLESYLSTNANPFTDSLALSGMQKLIPSIEKAVYEGHDLEARENMAYASMLSGVTLANAGLGVVHGFAQPLGSLFPIPHGIVCGTLMAAVNQVSLARIFNGAVNKTSLQKYAFLGSVISNRKGTNKEMALLFIEYLNELTDKLVLPKLSEFGVQESDFDLIIANTGLKNHPVSLEKEDLIEILKMRL